MIDYHTFCEIHHLLDQERLTVAQVATRLGLSHPTVEKWARRPTYQKADVPNHFHLLVFAEDSTAVATMMRQAAGEFATTTTHESSAPASSVKSALC